MLATPDNETLTQVGAGTPMGELFRRFWLPALIPSELPSPDCPPVRIRLLGEELVAFRDTGGNIGFLAANCPHRGASLFFGRNEENGLRCVYHGWKFDTAGNCTDMPNEPPVRARHASPLQHKVKVAAYPGVEWGGLIWIHMGPAHLRPELPQIEWATVPEEHRFLRKVLLEANYTQGMEGELDSAHASFLHRWVKVDEMPNRRGFNGALLFNSVAPILMVKDTDYGFAYGARRALPDGSYQWRVTQWLLPTHSMIPSPNWPHFGHVWTPIDDETTWNFYYAYNPERPLTQEEVEYYGSGVTAVPKMAPGTMRSLANAENDYLIDRLMQRTTNYTGITSSGAQDLAMAQSMGRVLDRTKEHLGSTDLAIIRARRTLISLARRLQQGIEPYAPYHGDVYRVRPVEAVDAEMEFGPLMERYRAEALVPAR